MYKISVLDNGLKIASCNLPNSCSVGLGIWVGVGGCYENKDLSGISHFVEHIVFKGSKNKTFRQIKESIEGVGGMLNGFTSEELTCYMAKVLKRQMPDALDVLIDMLFNPALKEKDIHKERLVIFEEMKMYFDLPHYLAYDNLIKLLWPNQPLGRNLVGSSKTLRAINKKQLIGYMSMFYRPDNMLICAAGSIKQRELLGLVKHNFKKYKINFDNSPVDYILRPEASEVRKNDICFVNRNTQQVHICLGTYALKQTHKMQYALALLHIILGANMSSRLFNEVREKKGYAYEIGTSLKSFRDTGAFIVHAGIVKEKIEYAIALILNELKKACTLPVSLGELNRAKEYYCGQLLMALEDTIDHMLWWGNKLMTQEKLTEAGTIIRMVKKVNVEDIREVANTVLANNGLKLSLIGAVSKTKRKTIQEILGGYSK